MANSKADESVFAPLPIMDSLDLGGGPLSHLSAMEAEVNPAGSSEIVDVKPASPKGKFKEVEPKIAKDVAVPASAKKVLAKVRETTPLSIVDIHGRKTGKSVDVEVGAMKEIQKMIDFKPGRAVISAKSDYNTTAITLWPDMTKHRFHHAD